jgi:hypothetical protein
MSGEPRFIRRTGAWALSLTCTAVVFLAAQALSGGLSLSPLVAYAFGFGCVVAATLAAGLFAPSNARIVTPIVLGVACTLGLAYAFAAGDSGWPVALAVSIALLAAGSALGSLVGARIESAGHLLFVALASALADVFSVTSPEGPSAAISKSDVALRIAAVSWPMIGTGSIEAFLGVGDVVFTGLYIASARRHELSMRRTLLALGAGYCATMLAVLALQVAVPALPFLGGAMLIAHPEARKPPLADRRRGFVALSVMAAVFLVLLLRPHD